MCLMKTANLVKLISQPYFGFTQDIMQELETFEKKIGGEMNDHQTDTQNRLIDQEPVHCPFKMCYLFVLPAHCDHGCKRKHVCVSLTLAVQNVPVKTV